MVRSKWWFAFLASVVAAYGLWEAWGAESRTDEPLAPSEAARTMVVPEGFRVSLFAGEPEVQQPISFCFDDRGRLWVAEAYNYPHHGTKPGDRILIFEDTNGDGQFDKRTVFYDQLNYVTGIEVGFGGAWVMSPPYFYFIPDKNGDDKPDDAPTVLLDGFGNHANSHNLANAFAWGPDGWLYGTHGRTNWSMLGKPGTPDDQRIRFDGGVYRYHPVRHEWEPFADGTTNPWGIDWDDYGQAFVCNCVNPHLFHVIQGAHYEPWRNRQSSQYAYERIETIADHLHYIGEKNVRDGLGSDAEMEAGGGHAHCGTMIYLGDSWPEKYRNTVFMNNIHGKRINNDLLKRAGSGYSASHGRDLMISRDPWYMGVTLRYGPDGSVFASDWSDTGECHSTKNTRRHTGRIFKISYGNASAARVPVDLAKQSDLELVQFQLHRNDWFVQHARRLLQERAAEGRDMTEVRNGLRTMFHEQSEVTRKLRALWALYVLGGVDDDFLVAQLSHASEYVRAWSVQFLCEDRKPPKAAMERFLDMASHGVSSLNRLYLASALQRLPPEQAWPLAEALAIRSEDANDQNLPLMVWYGVEPLVHDNVERLVALITKAKIPLVRRHIARRIASLPNAKAELNLLVQTLGTCDDETSQVDVLTGILKGLEGRRSVPLPAAWPTSYALLRNRKKVEIQELSLQLALVFDDPVALDTLRQQTINAALSAEIRNTAIRALVAKKTQGLAPLLFQLIDEDITRNAALRGLAEYDDPDTAHVILKNYALFDATARQDAVQTLGSRANWALALLDAIESQKIPRADITAFTARQLGNLKDERVSARVKALWGEVRATPEDKIKMIADYKKRLSPDSMQRADKAEGRAIFQKTCANCHKLFDTGGAIGPDITGSQRKNLDYLLENLIDPSAAVAKDYQMQIVETTAGRIITGLVVSENANAITIQTVNEKIVIPTNEIEERTLSPLSMMPEGTLEKLTGEQVRNLIAYLTSTTQVPLKETGR